MHRFFVRAAAGLWNDLHYSFVSSRSLQTLTRYGIPGVCVAAGILQQEKICNRYFSTWQRASHAITSTTKLEAKSDPTDPDKEDHDPSNDKNSNEDQDSFDLTETFNTIGKVSEDWKERLLGSSNNDKEKDETAGKSFSSSKEDKSEGLLYSIQSFLGLDGNHNSSPVSSSSGKSQETVQGMGKTLMNLLSGSNNSIDDVVQEVRDMSGRGEVQDQADVMEVFNVAKQCAAMLESQLTEFFGDDQPPPLYLTSMMYFIEQQDQLKNPSWKRRKHRFFPGIDMSQMDDCYEKMLLARLGYEDDIETIRESLQKNYNSELVYWSSVSRPNKPAHFVAVKRDQSRWSNELEVLIVVCGTKSITDVITDLLCDATPYRGGLAHSGILESGKWLVDKHKGLLNRLRELTNKKRVNLTLVGHSLGAAAATIAGIEWNDDPTINVNVMGFGCPALLSENLSQEVENYVTTIVDDSDCIPRMSLASMVNALMDVTELDITPYAKQDFQQMVDELQRYLPSLVDDGVKMKMLDNLHAMLPEPPKVDEKSKKRMKVELFPPGKIIHFYNDGYGVSGSVTPATFFDEIEVSRRLLDDHFFTEGYERIILDLMRQYHKDNFFTFKQHRVDDGNASTNL